jgi:hypothetical protein
LHGSPVTQAPDLDRIGPGYALRSQEMPTAEEFATARRRAAVLFGLHVPDVLFARNVGRLAGELRAKAAELETPVNTVRRALDNHAAVLGLTGLEPAARVSAARDAADLLARLTAQQDSTKVLRALASAGYDITDQELAAAIASAPAVLAAMESTPWQLLDSVRPLTDRPDDIGTRASQLIADVTAAAADNELERSLAPVLRGIQDLAYPLIKVVLDRERRTTPEPLVGPTGIEDVQPSSPPDRPARPRTPRQGSVHRVRAGGAEGELAGEIEAVRAEIRAYALSDPEAEIVIEWRVVTSQGTE